MSPYKKTPIRRPRKVDFIGGVSQGIVIDGIEICQSVQATDNSVTLIAGKSTLIRLYMDDSSVASNVRLRGELTLHRSLNGPAKYLASMNEVQLTPSSLRSPTEKRNRLSLSLNFRIPSDMIGVGQLYIKLNRLIQVSGNDLPFTGVTSLDTSFVAAPPIRVRCIGFRYKDPNTGIEHTPNAIHFEYFRSYLRRAYPVAEVIWSQIVVDANFAPPFRSNAAIFANAQIAAIRNTEINSGTDRRTHYYGLVDDANGRHFMRGRASGIPGVPQPDTVASGPCGTPNGFAGDNDLSYADWYGAHELGHTFGRYHPGFPPGQQDASDSSFPYKSGQISNSDEKYVGYDFGDPALGLPMTVLNGTTHHDVMTYSPRQWVSAYTFEAIRARLFAEDSLFNPPPSV